MRKNTFAIALLTLVCAARAGADDAWADLFGKNTHSPSFHGTDEVVVVLTNYADGAGRIVDRRSGAIRPLADVPQDATYELQVAGDRSYGAPGKRGVVAEGDLLVVRRSGKQKVWQLSTGAEVPAAPFLSFAPCRGGVVVLAGDGGGRVERLVAPGTTGGWLKEVAGIQANTLAASEDGVVVAGPGGWTELDPTGKELRTWRLPDGELPTTDNDLAATRTHVVGSTVLTFHPAREGGVKVRIFTGKRPKEVNVGDLAEPGLKVYVWTDEEVVARRGKKTYGLLARTATSASDATGAQTLVSIDLATGALGPEVMKEAGEFYGGNGHVMSKVGPRGPLSHVDVVTGAVVADGAALIFGAFSTRTKPGSVTCTPLAGGPAQTWKLPDPTDVTRGAGLRNCPCQDWLGVTNEAAGRAATPLGVLDLRSGKVLPLGTFPPEERVALVWVDGRPKGTLFFAETTAGRDFRIKVLRRDAPYRR